MLVPLPSNDSKLLARKHSFFSTYFTYICVSFVCQEILHSLIYFSCVIIYNVMILLWFWHHFLSGLSVTYLHRSLMFSCPAPSKTGGSTQVHQLSTLHRGMSLISILGAVISSHFAQKMINVLSWKNPSGLVLFLVTDCDNKLTQCANSAVAVRHGWNFWGLCGQ